MGMQIVWFRRDLRLHDNPALQAARRYGPAILPLFILDDAILAAPDTGAARVAFLLESLHALDAELRERGSRLVMRRGQPLQVLPALAEQAGAHVVLWNRDYTPFARRRDAAVQRLLEQRGVRVETYKDAVIFEAGEVRTRAGAAYTVFSPYLRAWREAAEQQRPAMLASPRLATLAPPGDAIPGEPLPSLADLGVQCEQELPPGGEPHGRRRLRAFAARGIGAYHELRDIPSEEGTSHLSAYLRLGCVSPVACLRAAFRRLDSVDQRAPGSGPLRRSIETWIGELAWRDFFYQIMASHPHVLRGAYRPQYDAIEWPNRPDHFAAWCGGATGYPIVDAGMRQLRRRAWVHNRVRMIVATFLIKDLLVDWRWGERFFMQQLVDGDHASNNGGWQWAAGTGSAAQPFFRIFNPLSQSRKFDPHGAYIRRYVPELARLPDRFIHAPWLAPEDELRRAGVELGHTYARPIVDHETQREHALALYRAARP